MKHRRRAFALVVLAAFVSSVGVYAQKDQQKDKKQDEAQKKEIQSIVKIVDDMAAGQPAPNDLSATWLREDHLKAQGNKEYVPFTVSIDPSKLGGATAAFYWRVVSKAVAAPAEVPAAGAKKDDKKDDKKDKEKQKYAYEDVTFVPVTAGQNPMRISRSFTVPAGSYDVYIVVKEPAPEKTPKNAPLPKMSAFKQVVNVPDFWNGELSTSSVLVAQRIDPLPAPLTPVQQADRPYALGAMEILPAWDMKMTKKAELSTFMLIYNPKVDSGNKPDVFVEYNFCQVSTGAPQPKAGEPCKAGEKFFNKTTPQSLNASTLPPQFDIAAGHQLQTGQAVPLASFPEGEYRLEIKVTDKIANKVLMRDVSFSVAP
jgi:hypothetical protein